MNVSFITNIYALTGYAEKQLLYTKKKKMYQYLYLYIYTCIYVKYDLVIRICY